MRRILAGVLLLVSTVPAAPALGQEIAPKSLWTFSYFRSHPDMSDEYLRYLATTWKAQREALVEEGAVLSYHVFEVKAQREGEPDIVIATEYADYVSFARRKELEDAVREKLLANPPKGAPNVELGTLREWLGSTDMEELALP